MFSKSKISFLVYPVLLAFSVLIFLFQSIANIQLLHAAPGDIVVNSLADVVANDGQCTLREAIIAANADTVSGSSPNECLAGSGDDTLDLTGLSGTIALGSSLPDIATSLVVQGPGAALLSVDGGGNGRIFTIISGTVILADLTIANGYEGVDDGRGGGIFNSSPGVVQIENSIIRDNDVKGASGGSACNSTTAPFYGGGGGIFHSGTGTLFVIDSEITGNSATGGNGGSHGYGTGGGGGGGAFGGGLFNDGGTVHLINSTLTNNAVTGGRGGPRGNGGSTGCGGAHGGGQYGGLGGGGRGGYSSHYNGYDGLYGGGGGGGRNAGGFGGVSAFAGGNGGNGGGGYGGAGGGGGALGGGLFNYSGTVYVTNSRFVANTAVGGEGPDNAEFGQGLGSAIFNLDTMYLDDSTVPNTAPIVENYSPPSNATDVSIDAVLTWDVSDVDGEGYLYGYSGAGLTVTLAFGDDPLNMIHTTDVMTTYVPTERPLQPATTYYWTITATDGISATNSGLLSFTTAPLPTVDFSAVSPQGARPFTTSFTNNTTDATTYLWDFGDGGSSTAVHPTHQYTNSGTYTVTLTAVGLGGTAVLTKAAYIFVYDLPVPNFSASPLASLTGQTVEFTNASQFSDSYVWNYGDGTTSAAETPTHSHSYTAPGTYTVVLTGTNAYGSQSFSRNNYISVYDPAVADFSASPQSGVAPLLVSFTNLSENATNYVWSYGNGGTSYAASPAHMYLVPGTYTVTLTAENPVSSDTAVKTAYITVYPQAVANFTATPLVGSTPLEVTFTNSSTEADDFVWDYGDGYTSTVSSAVHTHVYDTAGAYTVSLIARNAYSSDSRVRTAYVNVYDAPVASFLASPTSGTSPLLVSFTNYSLNDTSALWNFGDGSTSTALNPQHLYLEPGVYTVTLTAMNPGGSDTLTRSGYILVNSAPDASFTADVQSGTVPLAVTFTNSSTQADSYLWDYGDGTQGTTTAVTHTHLYTTPGSFTVSLTATNAFGSDGQTRTNYITTYAVPVPAFTAVPTQGAAPLSVQFSNTSLNATSYVWVFGDGSSSTAVSPTHIYTTPGVYTVTLTASNPASSQSLTKASLITVLAPPTPAFTADPTSGLNQVTVTFTNLSTNAESYVWDYGDGITSTVSSATHSHLYDVPGVYTVRLTASNAYASNTQTAANLITVYESPVADFEAGVDFGPSPLAVGFANLSTGATNYLWDFGDGHTSTAATPTHVYTQGGTYTVSLTASNPYASDTAVQTALINVYDEPIADFSATPRIGTVPLLVTFHQESQFATDVVWEYGDGSSSSTTAVAHTHLYTEPGSYTVTLSVSNPYAADAITRTAYITVLEPPAETAYYVDSDGGSNTGDGSQTDPWQTISYALSQVTGPNVTIYVATGTYNEALGELFPMTMEPGVSLRGADRQTTVIEGSGVGTLIQFPNTSIYTATTVLSGFKISNGVQGVRVDGSAANYPTPTITNNWLTGNEQGIYVTAVTDQRAYPNITHNWIENNTLYGINMNAGYNGTIVNPIIEYNRIAQNGQAGIRCYANGSGSSGGRSDCSPQISFNEIVANGGDGIMCQTHYAGRCTSVVANNFIAYNSDWGLDRSHSGTYIQASVDATTRGTYINNVIVQNGTGGAQFITNTAERFDQPNFINCTVADNGVYGVRNGRPTIVNSIIWGQTDDLNVSVAYVSYSTVGDGEYGGLNSNISSNPMFVGPTQADYHLSYLSPAIDAGNNAAASLPAEDFEGDARQVNGTVDMGADEFAIGPAVDVRVVSWPETAVPGGPLQYTLWVTNTGSMPLNAVVQANLPPQVSYSGLTSWEVDLDAPADVWQRSFMVYVAADYTGPITTEIVVSSAQGAEATAVITTTSAWPATNPLLSVTPSAFNLTTAVGEAVPAQTILISNAGTGTLNWTATDNATWLSLSASSGAAPAAIQMSLNAAALSPGTYTGQVTIQSSNAPNSPLVIPVTLNVITPEMIQLEAEGGYTSIMLSWTIANNPQVVNYRLLLGDNGADSENWAPVATVADTMYFYEDDTLAIGETVCFRVEGLQANGTALVTSNPACAVYGETTLWIPDVSAVPGEIAIVPVNIRNAEGLRMAATDIWLEYDATVLEPVTVQATPLTQGYIWSYSISAVAGSPDHAQAHIGALTNNPPTMYGDGSLFWVQFRVLGAPGETAVLDLRDFITGVGGSTIYTPDDLVNPIPLNLEDGLFVVDGSFMLGDLNGNGVVETVDAYIALRIAMNRIIPTAEQLDAGDVNGNGRIDVGDATMIFYRAVHGVWPPFDNLKPLSSLRPYAPLTIQLDGVSAKPGETVTTVLRAEGLTDWAGGMFTIVYDTAVIGSIEAVTPVGLAESFVLEYDADEPGLLHIGLMSDQAVAGSGDLVEIRWRINENATEGDSTLQLAGAALNDLYGRDFAVSALKIVINKVSGVLEISATNEVFLPLVVRP